MVDLTQAFTLKRHSFPILSPEDDEPIGLEIEMAGEDDDSVPAIKELKAVHKSEINGYMKRGKLKVPEGAYERMGREKLAARVTKLTWLPGTNFGGETPEASVKTLLDIFDTLPWVYEQIAAEGMSGNFYTKSGKPSSKRSATS